jgi:GNAT superfamily N-acetyltransferase
VSDGLYAAIHANRLVAVERVGHLNPRSRVERLGPWLLVDTGEPSFWLANSATPVAAASAADVATAVDWFARARSRFHFVVRSNADDALRAELARLRYERVPSETTMVLAAPQPPAYDGPLTIRPVATEADILAYGRDAIGVGIARTAFERGFSMLMGELEGRVVATSMGVVTGDVVGIYNVGVEEPYRRRGFGAAIAWAAIEAGMRVGATIAWTGSTEMGFSTYQRMGFRPHFAYDHLEPPAS